MHSPSPSRHDNRVSTKFVSDMNSDQEREFVREALLLEPMLSLTGAQNPNFS